MAFIRRNYRDLPVAKRRIAAKQALANLRSALVVPGLTAEQSQLIQAQMRKIVLWEAGAL